MPTMRRLTYILIILTAAASCILSSCSDIDENFSIGHGGSRPESYPERGACAVPKRHVLLLYSAGFNSLSSYLRDDIKDLLSGYVPHERMSENALLIYSHLPERDGNYAIPTAPVLYRVSRDEFDRVKCDTLVRYPTNGSISASALHFNEVLTYVKDEFPAESYGLIFSSHATGYLPAGYYNNPGGYRFESVSKMRRMGALRTPAPLPYIEPEHDPSLPAVKSIGEHKIGTYNNYVSYEMEIGEFARAIPMKLDYILFDACLMGGIEVAFELSGKTDRVGFSQTEVLAEGFDYKTITTHLLKDEGPDPESVCRDYFTQYDIQSGQYRSATISLVDCNALTSLKEVCSELFSTYANALVRINPDEVQRYYRYSYHWFYDLKDILAKAGATAEELASVDQALDKCVLYKAATPSFMGSFYIDSFCGLSMFLPSDGNAELSKYYRTLLWNQDTGLVK